MIQRYEIGLGGVEVKSSVGTYVLYADHLAVVESLDEDRTIMELKTLKWASEQIAEMDAAIKVFRDDAVVREAVIERQETRIKELEELIEFKGRIIVGYEIKIGELKALVNEMQEVIAHLAVYVPDLMERDKYLDWLGSRKEEQKWIGMKKKLHM